MSEKDFASAQEVQRWLRGLHGHLQVAYAGASVAAAALHYQNADRDEDIARVLEHCVGRCLAHEIERTAAFIAFLQSADAEPDDPGA